jgi:ankyrin repeat protein
MADWFDKLQEADEDSDPVISQVKPTTDQPSDNPTDSSELKKSSAELLVESCFEEVKRGNTTRLLHEMSNGTVDKNVLLPDGYTILHVAVERSDLTLLEKVMGEL